MCLYFAVPFLIVAMSRPVDIASLLNEYKNDDDDDDDVMQLSWREFSKGALLQERYRPVSSSPRALSIVL